MQTSKEVAMSTQGGKKEMHLGDRLDREQWSRRFLRVRNYCLAVPLAILLNLLVFFPILARDFGIEHPLRIR